MHFMTNVKSSYKELWLDLISEYIRIIAEIINAVKGHIRYKKKIANQNRVC